MIFLDHEWKLEQIWQIFVDILMLLVLLKKGKGKIKHRKGQVFVKIMAAIVQSANQ